MNLPYFIWRDADSRGMGLWVSQYPDRIRAAERVNKVTIPGRAGQLTLAEGAAVYESLKVQMRVQALRDADFITINRWLSGTGLLVLGSDPNYAYKGRITDAVAFAKVSNDLAEATIAFECEPFRRAFPDNEAPIVLTAAGTVINRGNVPSKPKIRMTVTGDVSLTIGHQMQFRGWGSSQMAVTIDCDACMITKDSDGGNLLEYSTGDFFTLEPGVNEVAWTGTVSECRIYPNARWL